MNFRFVDDLVGSAQGASQNGKKNIQQNITQQRLLKNFGKFI